LIAEKTSAPASNLQLSHLAKVDHEILTLKSIFLKKFKNKKILTVKMTKINLYKIAQNIDTHF
jgi:hypothetical protein